MVAPVVDDITSAWIGSLADVSPMYQPPDASMHLDQVDLQTILCTCAERDKQKENAAKQHAVESKLVA